LQTATPTHYKRLIYGDISPALTAAIERFVPPPGEAAGKDFEKDAELEAGVTD
jgi:hypothetical protein